MSVKRNEADQELARYVAAHEWWKDTTKGRDVTIHAVIEASGQKGVFVYTFTAVHGKHPQGMRTVAKVSSNFPNSAQKTFSAFLMGQLMKINQMVEDWLLDTYGETRTPR